VKGGFWLKAAICLVVVGVLAFVQPVAAAAAVLVGIGLAVVQTMRRTRTSYEGLPTDGLSLEAQARLRPLLAARKQIGEIAERNAGHPAIKVIGAEALQEADELIANAAGLLKARFELTRSSQVEDPEQVERLKARRDVATDMLERDRLDAAIALAEKAADHREKVETALQRIDAQLDEARAGLEQLRAELVASLTEDLDSNTVLRETLGRLQSLGTSLEEARELLQGTTGSETS